MKKLCFFLRTATGIITLLLVSSCNLINPPSVAEYEEVYVGLTGTLSESPTSLDQIDYISAYTQHSCGEEARDPAYDLQWDGNSFSANYLLNCQFEDGISVSYTINIFGKLSSNHQKLETFTGTRKINYVSGKLTDNQEFYIELKNVPIEGDEDLLSAFIGNDIGQYIVNAYWRRSKTENGITEDTQNGNLDYSNTRMELNISFNRIKTY